MFSHALRWLLASIMALTICAGAIAAPAQAISTNQTPTNPPLADYAGSFGGSLAGPAVNGDIAYIGEGQSLTILDISDAAHPARLARLPLMDIPRDLVLDSGWLYVADGSAGLLIYDIHDPVAPLLLGVFATPVPVTSMRIQGTLGYLIANDLLIVDLQDPAAPHQLGSFHPNRPINNLIISGGRAYLASGGVTPLSISAGSISIVDVSNPAAPTALGALQLPSEAALDIQIDGNLIYVVTVTDYRHSFRYPRLFIADISNVSSPTIRGSVTLTQASSWPMTARILVADGLAYIAGYPGGLMTLDIQIPTTPTLVRQNSAIGGSDGLRLAGEQLYAIISSSYLQIISLSAPASPALLGSYNAFPLIQGVAVANGIAHIGIYSSGFQLIDVHDPARPIMHGAYTIGGAPDRMQLAGDLTYVAGGNSGLNILDTADIDNPIRLGGLPAANGELDMRVVGTFAYIVKINQLAIVDISDPSNPIQRGIFSQPTALDGGVDVMGSRAYFATGNHGLTVVDVSDPAHPVARGAYTALARASFVQVVGNRAYVAAGSDGLVILDLTNPDSPTRLGQAYGPQNAVYVRVVNGLAYVADYYSGVQIFDVRNPAAPVLLGQYAASGNVTSLDIEGDMLYIPAGNGGLQMVRLHRDQLPLTITSATPASGTYGTAYHHAFATSGMPTARFSLSGILPPGLSFDASAMTISGTPTQSGTWNDLNFTASYGDGHDATQTFGITIGKAPLTLIAANASKTYGQPTPALTFTAAGLLNGDTVATALTGSPATLAQVTSPAGSYDITQGTLDAANYAISFTQGELTVDKAPLIATAEPQVRNVGSVNPPLTVSYSGFVNGEDERVLDSPPTTSTAADANSPVGIYAITIGGGSDDNYAFTYVNGTLTVSSKDVPEIAWAPESITYGVPLGPAQLNATASFGGQSVDGTFSYATTAGTVLDAGAHTLQVVFNPSDSATYAAAPASAQLIVAKAPLTLIAANASKTYGQPTPALTFTAAGLLNGDTVATALTGSPATSAQVTSPAGSYDITQGTLDAANYTITFVPGALNITKAPLTVTAADQTRRVGQTNAPLTLNYQGFVNNDDASDLDILPIASTSADAHSGAGTYAITVRGGSDTNYAFTYVNGTLTITDKHIPTITWLSPAAITYGVKLTDAQFNASATVDGQFVAGTFSYTPAVGTLLDAGSAQVLKVTFTPADTANYASVTAQAGIDVAKAPLTITAEDEAMVAGGIVPALTARYSGFVNGEDAGVLDTPVTVTTSASSASMPGRYSILASEAADANYAITFMNGTLTVRPAERFLVATNGDHGHAGSIFTFAAQGFRADESIRIAVDGRAVLVAKANASGRLRFVLFFGPTAPARSYTVTATATDTMVQFEAGAQTQVTIDPAAPKLLPPSDTTLPLANALPTIFLPLTSR